MWRKQRLQICIPKLYWLGYPDVFCEADPVCWLWCCSKNRSKPANPDPKIDYHVQKAPKWEEIARLSNRVRWFGVLWAAIIELNVWGGDPAGQRREWAKAARGWPTANRPWGPRCSPDHEDTNREQRSVQLLSSAIEGWPAWGKQSWWLRQYSGRSKYGSEHCKHRKLEVGVIWVVAPLWEQYQLPSDTPIRVQR